MNPTTPENISTAAFWLPPEAVDAHRLLGSNPKPEPVRYAPNRASRRLAAKTRRRKQAKVA